jgi:DNA modification methylase
MQIIYRAIGEIKPYENNPRFNESAVEIVAKSIREFGFKVPIVLDEHDVIVTGHTRHKAALKLGLKEVPCIVAKDLDDDQIKAFRLADNKTAEYAQWDIEKLNQELRELQLLDFDMGQFDFKIEAKAEDDAFDFDEALAAITEPITKPGDVWILGNHRLMCGDSTSERDVKTLMNGQKAHLVITDPPYNVGLGYDETPEEAKARNRRTDGKVVMNDLMSDNKFREFLTAAFTRMKESMAPGAPIYVFHADREGYNFYPAFKDAGLKMAQCIIWVKNSLIMGRQDYQSRHEPILYGWKEGAAHFWCGDRTQDTVIDDDKISFTKAKREDLVRIIKDLQAKMSEKTSVIYHDKPSTSSDHPTMKPVRLVGKLMSNSSDRGALVLDTFGGSGTTLMAAEQLGRICYTMELDPKYCDVIVQRWEEFTYQQAVKANG